LHHFSSQVKSPYKTNGHRQSDKESDKQTDRQSNRKQTARCAVQPNRILKHKKINITQFISNNLANDVTISKTVAQTKQTYYEKTMMWNLQIIMSAYQ